MYRTSRKNINILYWMWYSLYKVS